MILGDDTAWPWRRNMGIAARVVTPPGPLVISQYYYPKLGFDPTAFVPVTIMVTVPPITCRQPEGSRVHRRGVDRLRKGKPEQDDPRVAGGRLHATTGLALDDLTSREREVLESVAQGLDNSGISTRLKISEKTIRNHVSTIFGKLGVNSRAQAVAVARDAGFGRRIGS
jgi:DNA-binding CsgD family transcriptional regulator